MKLFCPECRSTFDESETVCPNDGTRLYRLDPADDPLVGATLDGRYRIDWLIGEGGMGAVYRGIQLSVNREIAIKVLRTELNDREVALERFFREAKLVSELSHPNIVRVVDFGQDHERDLLFLVMEMVRGVSLGDLLEQGRLRVNFALELAYQVCGALTEPHAAGIVHRDLKPDNLLLVPVSDGTVQVKVLDFGIARALERNTRLTATGMICGTPAYMAPEQSRNQELDARTDLYALGVLLYEMLAGLPPFSGQSSLQIMLKHIQEEPARLRDILPPSVLPEQLEDLVHDMMSKERDDRPQNAHDVRQRIEALRAEFDFDPVRIDTTLDEEEMFEEWLLPSLPTAAEATHSETQALRRETGLFDHLEDDAETNIAEAATVGMDSADEHRSEELDEVMLNDTEVEQMAPTTPAEIPVLEAKVSSSATAPGPASAWTPGPRRMVPVKDGEGHDAPGPGESAMERAPTSELSSATESEIDDGTGPQRDHGAHTNKRPQVEADDEKKVSTTATVLMSVAGSAVIMALFAIAFILYFESTTPTQETDGEQPAVESLETTNSPAEAGEGTLAPVDTTPQLSATSGEADDGSPADDTAAPKDDKGVAAKEEVDERGSDEKPSRAKNEQPEQSDGTDEAKTEPVKTNDEPEETAADETTPPPKDPEPDDKSAAKQPQKDSSDQGEQDEVDEQLENIFESGSLRSE